MPRQDDRPRIRGPFSFTQAHLKDYKYFCYGLHTNVTGYGKTPNEALKDFRWMERCPV